jgi:LysR family hydrogen peroxide-inducible transcriptional activator
MTLTQLSYVVAVDTHRHFAKAAEQCFVSQPTLSMQIQKLEDELGIAIFDRSKQPIVPTVIGVKIIQQARVILTESARVDDIISTYSDKVAGEFRIGIIPTVAAYLVPLFLQSFMKRYPDVELSIDEIQTDVIIDYLQKDQLDIGILATPLSMQGIVENPIYYEPFVAYLPKKHRLLALDKLSADDLIPGELMLLDEGNCFREQTIQLCNKFGEFSKKHKKMHFEGGNLETLKRLVDKDFGITVLPYLMVSDFQNDDEKSRCRPFTLPQPTREISVVHGKSFLKSQIIKAFTHELKSHLPSELLNRKDSNVLTFK